MHGREPLTAPAADTGAAESPQASPVAGLTERERRLLDFEERWPRHGGRKDEAIRAEFGFSAARYYQLLNVVMDSPAAFRHDPLLVGRLRRVRDHRRSVRSLTADVR